MLHQKKLAAASSVFPEGSNQQMVSTTFETQNQPKQPMFFARLETASHSLMENPKVSIEKNRSRLWTENAKPNPEKVMLLSKAFLFDVLSSGCFAKLQFVNSES